ncbi:hypothetical protein AALO_G00005950, partial [Alosa alosa]
MECRMGFRGRETVRLADGAVPSVHANPKSGWSEESEVNVSTSRESVHRKRELCTDTDSKVSEICIIQGCNRTEELLSFPKDPSTLQQWMALLDGRLKHPVNSSSTVCSVHFTPDCFTNWQQKQSGVAAILTLKADALPSLFMDDRSKGVQGYSPRTRNVDCQCDIGMWTASVTQRSVGTQLSKGTLLHVRSKGM